MPRRPASASSYRRKTIRATTRAARRSAIGSIPRSSHRKMQTATKPGDMIVVQGRRVGEPVRMDEILEALGGHISLYYPSKDATVRHRVRRGAL